MTATETSSTPAAASPKQTKANAKKISSKQKAAKSDRTSHPPYAAMIKKAIIEHRDKKGTSKRAILKYIVHNYVIPDRFCVQANNYLRAAIKRGVKTGALKQMSGTGLTGSFKIADKVKSDVKKKPKAAPKKKAATGNYPSHPPYAAMIRKAILDLNEKKGSSKSDIMKYITRNYGISDRFCLQTNCFIRTALKRGVETGALKQISVIGSSGLFKLGDKVKFNETKKPKAAQKKKAATGAATTKEAVGVTKAKKPITKKSAIPPATEATNKKLIDAAPAPKKSVTKASKPKKVATSGTKSPSVKKEKASPKKPKSPASKGKKPIGVTKALKKAAAKKASPKKKAAKK